MSRHTRARVTNSMKRARDAGYFCTLCGKKMQRDEVTAEHLIPRSKGGSNHRYNLTSSCAPCNSRRSDNTHILPKFNVTTGYPLLPDEVKRMMAWAMKKSRKPPATPEPPHA